MKTFTRLTITLVLGILLHVAPAWSQGGGGGGGGCGMEPCELATWSPPITETFPIGKGCEVTVTYSKRFCDFTQEMQFRILSMSLTGDGCNMLKDSSAQQLTELALINKTILDFFGPIERITACPNPFHVKSIQFITTACYVWQKCTYDVTPALPVCDTPPVPEVPPSRKVDVWTRHDCGTACCKKTYEVCKQTPLTGGSPFLKVISTSKQLIGTCTQQATFSKTCNTGC